MTPRTQIEDPILAGAAQSARIAERRLLNAQFEQGYWWADLTADTTLESDWLLLQLWLHPPVGGVWNPPERELIDKAVRSILDRQLEDGGFNIYPEGPSEISACVKAYFALKLAGGAEGIEPARYASSLDRLKERVLALGGIQAANSYTKINLSFFGLYPREGCPSVPPEMVLLPWNFMCQMSSWTRAIVTPLAIIHAMDPRRPAPDGFDLKELFLPGIPATYRRDKKWFTWRNFFLMMDRCVKRWERWGSKTIRQRAIRRAEQWMLERTRYTDGLGAIYPPMQYIIMALDLLGYSAEHPDRVEAQKQFDRLLVNRDDRFYFQPCFSVVWDTAIAAFALGESEGAPSDELRRAADWLLTKEVRRKGDWSIKRPKTEPSGWYFEFANEYYPDIDDTAMVLLALSRSRATRSEDQQACEKRAIAWLLDMQSKNGGWAAFDVDNNWHSLSEVPFADHNAMLDPTCPDITGRVLEALCAYGLNRSHKAVERGVQYLIRTQENDGSWYGRWGVDYIYGTFLALRGLQAAGENDNEAYVQRALEWVRSTQNFDGGWGESCASYKKNAFVPAASTPSQTAWAVLALLAGGDTTSTSLRDGVNYLVKTQNSEGTWDEELATGTGFPGVFYLKYHLYRHSFPLLALNAYVRTREVQFREERSAVRTGARG